MERVIVRLLFKNFLQADVIGSTLAVRLDCAVLPITIICAKHNPQFNIKKYFGKNKNDLLVLIKIYIFDKIIN
jgi:hypothetical protein